MGFKRRLLFLVPSSICWKVFYLKYDVILNKALEYIIKAPCLCSSNSPLHIKWSGLRIMADKYMLIKDVLEEITFMKQLFIFFILIRVGFSIKNTWYHCYHLYWNCWQSWILRWMVLQIHFWHGWRIHSNFTQGWENV